MDDLESPVAELNPVVHQTIKDLLDDYARQGNKLKYSDIDRLVEKRDLTSKEGLFIYDQLSLQGIDPEFDEVFEEPSSETALEENDIEIDEAKEPEKPQYDLLGALMKDASKEKLLTPEEEIQLGRAVAIGLEVEHALARGEVENTIDAISSIARAYQARDKMIRANMRLVINIANKFKYRTNMDLTDLIQDGMTGLIKAVEKFDHSKGFRFSTYATWWIRQAIFRSIDDKGATIRLPVHMMEAIRKLKRAQRIVDLTKKGRVSIEDLAIELKWTPEKTLAIYQASQLEPISMDAPVNADGETTLSDYMASSDKGPEHLFEQVQLKEKIEELVSVLTPRQADIIKRRFGFTGNPDGETLEKIGQCYKVTRERIRQIEAAALRRLKHPSKLKKVRIFVE